MSEESTSLVLDIEKWKRMSTAEKECWQQLAAWTERSLRFTNVTKRAREPEEEEEEEKRPNE